MKDKIYLFGVDVGGTGIKIGLFKKDGYLVEKWEIPTNVKNGGNEILPDIAKALKEKMAEKGIAEEEMIGVGIGVPGPVDEKGVVHRCVNLGWGTFSIVDCLSELLNMPIKAANDANVAALGEMWKGCAMGCSSLVFITLGTGIGGGVIVDKKVVTGENGSGGEIGHITVNVDEEASCNCGKQGCVEQYASATGMVRMAKKLIEEGKEKSSIDITKHLTAKAIVDEAKKGDAVALQVVDIMGKTLGLALGAATCMVDPQVILIGGGVSKAGDIVLNAIEKYYRMYAFHATKNTPIKLATLGNDAGIYGAARQLL
ncbi:MAG: ROK family glucokinase [Lachnospiraceae bacterium]|nr:ROK family glucokinase [Lachnospiraceae bacterium]